jgi:hypothetical protein
MHATGTMLMAFHSCLWTGKLAHLHMGRVSRARALDAQLNARRHSTISPPIEQDK